jgi:two-component system sensor histidine kinase BaeS
MIRYLAVKLTLAFLLVSVLGAVLVAVLVNWQTQREFDQLVHDIYQNEFLEAGNQLAMYYLENESWEGVSGVLLQEPDGGRGPGTRDRHLPVTLVGADRRVVFGGPDYRPGEVLPERVLNGGAPIKVEGETVGWIVLDSFGGANDPNSPEANFLANVNRATIFSALGAAAAALLLGVFLARTISQPVSELQEATERVAGGQLGRQVAVRSRDEIGRLAISFNRMSADLAQANELRKQMTADIAHDLRTPLSVIQGYTEALDEGKLSGNSEIYQAMHKQVKHLNRLVEDLRTLSLADAGQLSLHRVEVALRDLLEHSILVYTPQAEQKGVTLQLDLPPALPKITVDLDRMAQVLDNLISNALRHTPAGGEIRLAARRQNHHLLLLVQDTGAGIAPEDLPHVFDRFYRGDKARSDSGESGLGLAIARSIVEAHNGRIDATSVLGQGTTFTISLPLNTQ